MRIRNEDILAGEEKRIVVNIARLPSHSPIDIYLTICRSKKPGPTLLLSGGLHGDEINGIEIVRRITEQGLHRPERGTVICMPVINIFGFIHTSRYVPDGKDVNRSFPGSTTGSLASRVANFLTKEILPVIDYGIDFHTGGGDRTNYPQIRCQLKDPKNEELAYSFHAPFTLDAPLRPHSMRQVAMRMGKRILVYEGGESGRLDEYAIEHAIKGTLRVMHHLGMRHTSEHPNHDNHVIKHSSWVRARNSGIFLSSVKYGQQVKKNDTVGYINDPFGDFKSKLKAPAGGYILGLNHHPIVHQGDALMHIGY
jgi:predicted deacylase